MNPESYLQFGVPGLPYSAVRIPLVADLDEQDAWVARAMNAAQLLANAYYESFGGAEPSPEPAPRAQPRPAPQPAARANGVAQAVRAGAPRAPQRQPAPPRRAATQTLDPELIVEGYCPEHPGVKALPSIPRYQEVEMGDDGYERYAKYFCPGKENGTGQNHQLFARQLVAVEPDDLPF